jgi:small subunit ribosomal protein S17
MKEKIRNIGLKTILPEKECKDQNCPYHGKITVRGRIFIGKVISDKAQKTVTVSWPRIKFVKKYERYETKMSKLKAHNPDCIDAQHGDLVRVMETKPISKTKHFVVIEIIK